MTSEGEGIEKFLDHLNSDELLFRLNWEEWLGITPPNQDTKRLRYRANAHSGKYLP